MAIPIGIIKAILRKQNGFFGILFIRGSKN
jgi:hypothetical protein